MDEDDDEEIILGQPHPIAFDMDEERVMYVNNSFEHLEVPMLGMKVARY